MPPNNETPPQLYPFESLLAFVICMIVTLIAWQVCRHKRLQMKGKRRRKGEYASGANVNIFAEMDPWQQMMWIGIVLCIVTFVYALYNNAPVLIINRFK